MLFRLMLVSLLVSSVSFAQTPTVAKMGGKLQWKKMKGGREEYLALTNASGTYSLSAVKGITPKLVKLAETESAVEIVGELRPDREVIVREITSK